MIATVKKLLESRKFAVMLVSMVAAIAARMGLPAEAADQVATTIVVLAATYVGAQGLSDLGKEAAKEKSDGSPSD